MRNPTFVLLPLLALGLVACSPSNTNNNDVVPPATNAAATEPTPAAENTTGPYGTPPVADPIDGTSRPSQTTDLPPTGNPVTDPPPLDPTDEQIPPEDPEQPPTR